MSIIFTPAWPFYEIFRIGSYIELRDIADTFEGLGLDLRKYIRQSDQTLWNTWLSLFRFPFLAALDEFGFLGFISEFAGTSISYLKKKFCRKPQALETAVDYAASKGRVTKKKCFCRDSRRPSSHRIWILPTFGRSGQDRK